MRLTFGFALFVVLSGTTTLAPLSRAAEDKVPAHKLTAEHEECAKAAASCALICEMCQRHCSNLVAAGDPKHVTTMRLCQDCAEFCALTARLVARRGPTWQISCDACARVCDGCGKRCAEFTDDHMKRCAKACQACAKTCRAAIATAKKK